MNKYYSTSRALWCWKWSKKIEKTNARANVAIENIFLRTNDCEQYFRIKSQLRCRHNRVGDMWCIHNRIIIKFRIYCFLLYIFEVTWSHVHRQNWCKWKKIARFFQQTVLVQLIQIILQPFFNEFFDCVRN